MIDVSTNNRANLRGLDGTDDATIDAHAYSSGGVVGVTCPAGTFNPATAVITNGLVTHC